jgi:hypothetical protein
MKSKKTALYLCLSLTSVFGLVACGGGSDNTSSAASPTLNLNAANRNFVTEGSYENANISGYCSGTKNLTFYPAYTGTTYNGLPAKIVQTKEVDVLTTDSPALCRSLYNNNSSNGTDAFLYDPPFFYDPETLVFITDGSNPKTIIYTNQQPFPTSVNAGSSGTFSTYINYYGNSSPVSFGALTWKVAADTASTLLFITTDTSILIATGQLAYTSVTTYRITAQNVLVFLSKTVTATGAITKGAGEVTVYETAK